MLNVLYCNALSFFLTILQKWEVAAHILTLQDLINPLRLPGVICKGGVWFLEK